MSEVGTILDKAHQRAQEFALPYSGVVLPQEAWALLQALPEARLVDVRSAAEWQFVGGVPGAVCIEWKTWPGMLPNPDFLAQLQRQVDPEAVLLLLCRTGARSDDAARLLAANGYASVYNIAEGFEGERDGAGHRGGVNGWQAHGLPWQQA